MKWSLISQLDNALLHLPMFVVTWGMFSLAATTHFFLQAYLGNRRLSLGDLREAYFPFKSWIKPSAKIDIIIFVVAKLIYLIPLGLAWTSLAAGLVMVTLTRMVPHHEVHQADYLAIILCGLAIFLISDFSRYVTHYLQHFVPILWEFHKVHHSATFLNPLTAEREHPLGKWFDGITNAILTGCTAGTFAFVYKLSWLEISLLAATVDKFGSIIVPNSLKHSHFPISYGVFEFVLISPRMHHVHHSARLEHWDRNFGNRLSIWDICFGTRYIPRPTETIALGLGTAEEAEHENFWGVYVSPFVKIGSLLTNHRRRYRAGDTRLTTGLLWREKPNETFAGGTRL